MKNKLEVKLILFKPCVKTLFQREFLSWLYSMHRILLLSPESVKCSLLMNLKTHFERNFLNPWGKCNFYWHWHYAKCMFRTKAGKGFFCWVNKVHTENEHRSENSAKFCVEGISKWKCGHRPSFSNALDVITESSTSCFGLVVSCH